MRRLVILGVVAALAGCDGEVIPVFGVVGVVGSGHEGPAGAAGPAGANGKDGVDGQPGPAGAAGPAGQDAAMSGSRLKAIYWHGADGSRESHGFLDTELDAVCSFLVLDPAKPDEARCVPEFEQIAGIGYELPDCTGERASMKSINGKTWVRTDEGFFRSQTQTGSCYYQVTGSDCASCGPGDWYRWTKVQDTEFAGATMGQ